MKEKMKEIGVHWRSGGGEDFSKEIERMVKHKMIASGNPRETVKELFTKMEVLAIDDLAVFAEHFKLSNHYEKFPKKVVAYFYDIYFNELKKRFEVRAKLYSAKEYFMKQDDEVVEKLFPGYRIKKVFHSEDTEKDKIRILVRETRNLEKEMNEKMEVLTEQIANWLDEEIKVIEKRLKGL